MVKSKGLPNYLCGKTIYTIVYILNRIPTKRLRVVALEEAWVGSKLDVSHFWVFGSMCFRHILDQLRRKLDDKGVLMVRLGYHSTSDYKLFNPRNKQTVVTRDLMRYFEEAMQDPKWVNAMEDGLKSCLPTKKSIVMKWAYRVKVIQNSYVLKYKTRFMAKRSLQRVGVDYGNIFAPIARISIIRMPQDFGVIGQEAKIYRLRKDLYGLKGLGTKE
ncbi:hypothetical protein CR513_08551, partial [Mucuna pruriens]